MWQRSALGLLALFVLSPACVAQSPTLFDPVDFKEYWSASRVHLNGGNPYDAQQILPLQQLCANEPELETPTMLWTPPWTLPLYWPSGLLEPREAHLVWLLIQTLCCLISAILIWLVYGGAKQTIWLPAVLTLFSAPMAWGWVYGQNTGFLLLGLAGFAYCKHRNWHYLAGVFAALTAVKPHFLALFGWALLLDVYRSEGRKSLLAGVGMLLVASLLALIPNPEVFQQFVTAITSPTKDGAVSVSHWKLPLLSYQLRLLIDPENGKAMGFGFVPLGFGVIALTIYWWKQRDNWNWFEVLPWLVFGSALLAPYGGWLFDLVVLLYPMCRLLPRIGSDMRLLLLYWFCIGPGILLIANKTMDKLQDGWWITPALLCIYLGLLRITRPK